MDNESIKKKHEILVSVLGMTALIGVALTAFALLIMSMWTNVIDENHLSDPSLPYTEYPQNATFVWTHAQIVHQMSDYLIPTGIGLILSALGIGGLILLPSKKDWHIAENHAVVPGEKYCSECGLKLSLLEKKKK